MSLRLASLLLVSGSIFCLACGGSNSGSNNNQNKGPDMAVPYMTMFPPAPPQVQRGTGPQLAKPKVIPIFFNIDPFENSLETFLQNYITGSTAWDSVLEYGVSHGTVNAATVISQTLPAQMADSDIQSILSTNVQSGKLPTPDANTVYILYISSGVTVTRGGLTGCTDFAGYHDTMTIGGMGTAYAVILRCKGMTLPLLTFASSHELAEASTDPVLASYSDLQDPYDLWQANDAGTEIGDLCENLADAAATENGVGVVSRLWSNAAAAAWKNPCLPAPAGPSFFSIPILTSLQPVEIGTTIHQVEMVSVPAGGSATIEVKLLDNDTPSPTWSVGVLEVPIETSSGTTPAPALTFAWQEAPGQAEAKGQNGTTLHLEISAAAKAPTGLTSFRLISTGPTQAGGQTQTLWVGTVYISPAA